MCFAKVSYTIPIIFILDIDIKPEPKEKPILEEVKVEPIKVESNYEEIFEKPFQISPAPLTNHPIVIEEPLHDNENKPKVLESIPDLENNKIHPILEPSKGTYTIHYTDSKVWDSIANVVDL